MPTTNRCTSKVSEILSNLDTLSPAALKAALQSALKPAQKFGITWAGTSTPAYIEGARGVRWFPYAELMNLGGTYARGLVSNGRWYAIDKNGRPIAGTAHKGSSNPISLTKLPVGTV